MRNDCISVRLEHQESTVLLFVQNIKQSPMLLQAHIKQSSVLLLAQIIKQAYQS
jgi:hypothetical protein